MQTFTDPNGKRKADGIDLRDHTDVPNTEEVWKHCHFTDLYEVSNLGRVRRTETKNVRSNAINSYGYQYLTLPVEGKGFTSLVGRLVLCAFERLPTEGEVAHHVDGNPANDVLGNLAWTSMRDVNTTRNHSKTVQSKHVIARNSVGEVSLFVSSFEAASFFGCERSTVYDAIMSKKQLNGHFFEYDESDKPTCAIRKVVGSDYHLVSSDGRVQMMNGRWTVGHKHCVTSKIGISGPVYMRVEMTIPIDGVQVRKKKYVHVVVAEAFIGECPHGHQVDHLDGNTSNNDISNLQYVSKSDNNKRAYKAGRKPPGEKSVVLIKRDGTFSKFKSSSEGARQMGVNVATISVNCKSGRKNKYGQYWAHDKPVIGESNVKYESLTDASEKTGESALSILVECRNMFGTTWRFE